MPIRISLVSLLALAACAPAVTHGPRVHPGAELVATVGLPRPLCGGNGEDCNAGQVPTWAGGLRYGFAPRRPGGVGALAGITVPIIDPLSAELDAYVQGPSRGPWAWGGGALSSARHVMPYAQVGRVPAGNGLGWYATAGYAHLFRDPALGVGQREGDSRVMVRPPRYWAPAVAVSTREDESSLTLFVQGAFGSYVQRETLFVPDRPEPATVVARKPVRTLLIGIAWTIDLPGLRLPGAR